MSSLLDIYKLLKVKIFNENYKKKCNTLFMKINKILAYLFIITLVSGCAIITDEYQANQRKVIAYLLEDLPLPDDAEIIKAPTVLLGTGEAISGRIILQSGFSPAENLIFYGTETLSTGWQLISSKVGEEITLVYSKSGRFATIFIAPRNTVGVLLQVIMEVTYISVVHPDAIGIQNPYEDLNYDSLPESP